MDADATGGRAQARAEGTHCTWCGAEYGEPGPAPPVHGPTVPSAARRPDGEPLTHCEWCGAEYPEPPAGPAGA